MRDTALEEPPRPAREPGPAPPVPTTKSASVNVQVESLKGLVQEQHVVCLAVQSRNSNF